jgi:hypothetical protein
MEAGVKCSRAGANRRLLIMNAVRIETTIQTDGELYLCQLPCRRGDKIEAIILVLDSSTDQESGVAVDNDENEREQALKRFLERAQASKFRSTGPYPSRDELHERGFIVNPFKIP